MFQDLVQMTDNVWLYPRDENLNVEQPNIGVVTTDTQTVLIDAGNSPRHGRGIMRALATISAPPVDYLIYTHHHWDHVFGGMVFSVPMIIAHQQCADILFDYSKKPWSSTHLREESHLQPSLAQRNSSISQAVDDWRGFRINLPTIAIESAMTLYLNNITLDIQHVGGKHATDSIIIGVRERGIAFIGDCLYAPPSYVRDADTSPAIKARVFKRLFDAGYTTFIEGHNKPLASKDIQQALNGLSKSDEDEA